MKKLIKTINLEKISALAMIKFGTLLLIVSLAPLINHQLITGTIINATLFITVIILGIYPALFITFIPSLIALMSGLLPIIMAPMIPFIVISNIIMVLIFNRLKLNYWIKITSASLLKFVFLSFVTYYFTMSVMEINPAIISMMSWPQLFTALSGGLLAYLIVGRKYEN